jgi:hypothetical protein
LDGLFSHKTHVKTCCFFSRTAIAIGAWTSIMASWDCCRQSYMAALARIKGEAPNIGWSLFAQNPCKILRTKPRRHQLRQLDPQRTDPDFFKRDLREIHGCQHYRHLVGHGQTLGEHPFEPKADRVSWVSWVMGRRRTLPWTRTPVGGAGN